VHLWRELMERDNRRISLRSSTMHENIGVTSACVCLETMIWRGNLE
jgi:hypothetical protein